MSCDVVVTLTGLSKTYRVFRSPSDRIKQAFFPRNKAQKQEASTSHFLEFDALSNITLEVRRGQVVGILGPNGSGKSTLLKILSGALRASSGHFEVKGRIGALLELGVGFSPEFSGRDNVFMLGALLGFSKTEISSLLPSICEFADIGEFFEQPVKVYSSGMTVRLAFAVYSQLSPDVFIVDEALSVGDVRFQLKCFARLKQLKESGTTILLVSHSTEQIATHCDRAILLDKGRLILDDSPRKVINHYLDLMFGKKACGSSPVDVSLEHVGHPRASVQTELPSTTDQFSSRTHYNPSEYRWGDKAGCITDFILISREEMFPSFIVTGDEVLLLVTFRFDRDIVNPIFGFAVKTKEGVTLYGTNSELKPHPGFIKEARAGSAATVAFRFVCLLPGGDYFFSIGLASRSGVEIVPHDRRYDSIHVKVQSQNDFSGLADLQCILEPCIS
jgi:lipopolysaccharide transport system ATP-binding protein